MKRDMDTSVSEVSLSDHHSIAADPTPKWGTICNAAQTAVLFLQRGGRCKGVVLLRGISSSVATGVYGGVSSIPHSLANQTCDLPFLQWA